MIADNNLLAIDRIAKQRQYGFGSAAFDLTGVGTLYNIGADIANRGRLQQMHAATQSNPAFSSLVREYSESTDRSLTGRALYLAGALAVGFGYHKFGGITMILTAATFFLGRAGFNSIEKTSIQEMLANLKATQQEKKV